MSDYYKINDLHTILDVSVEQYEADFGKPDKTIDSFYEYNGVCSVLNQCRIYQKAKRILIITSNKLYVLPFSKIIGYDVINKSLNNKKIMTATTITSKADTGNLIKRAIIGGVVAGGVGAVIGGVTAQRNTNITMVEEEDTMSKYMNSSPNLELAINTDEVVPYYITISFENLKKQLKDFVAILNDIIKNNAESELIDDAEIEECFSKIWSTCKSLNIVPYDISGKTVKELKEEAEQRRYERKNSIQLIVGGLILLAIIIFLYFFVC